MAEKSNIYEKLNRIQCDLKVEKGRMNKFGGYKYRSLEDILKAVKPLLEREKCVITFSDEIVPFAERYYLKTTLTLTDTESGEYIQVFAYAREAEVKKGMDDSQITGSTSSYARKYAANAMFAVDDGIDADSMDNSTPTTLNDMEPAKRKKIVEAIQAVAPKGYKVDLSMSYEDAKKLYSKFAKEARK